MNTYHLEGNMTDINDSLQVDIIYKDSIINSTFIIDGQFSMTGSVDEPIYVQIGIHNTANQMRFWLENSSIIIESPSQEFGHATIQGSTVQLDQDRYDQYISKTRNSISEVYWEMKNGNENDSLKGVFNDLMQIRYRQDQTWVIENSNSPLSKLIFEVYHNQWQLSEIDSMIPKIDSKELRETMSHHVSVVKSADFTNGFVDFDMLTPSGNTAYLSTLLSEYTLINFWAGWCGPCRRKHPELIEIYNEFNSDGFSIVGVSFDDSEKTWKKAITDDQLPWPQLSDLKGISRSPVASIYNIKFIPDNVLIDPNGQIIGRNLSTDSLRITLGQILL